MAKNRKNQPVTSQFGLALKVVLACIVIGGAAVGFVWQKNEIYRLGQQIRLHETKLLQLQADNKRLGEQIMILHSPVMLDRRAKELNLGLAPASPFQVVHLVETPVAGPGSTMRPHEMAEGPSLLKRDNLWYLYWDAFANGHYSLATSTDLKNWTDRTAELQLPPNPRHGTVSRMPRSAVGWLSKPPAHP